MSQNHFSESTEAWARQPDWSREQKRFLEWKPGCALLMSIRFYQKHAERRSTWSRAMQKVAVIRHRFWSAVSGADIPLNTKFGGGLALPHPNGVVIHPDSVIGINCMIMQQVTLAVGRNGAPQLGAHVDIGAGAKILGGVRIGTDAQIGANAVVLTDVPDGATAVGVPARIIPKR
jgi:serine O-acetyltransferase